ncbi:MAG TPA: hypothetical protein EYP53_10030 [Candidatus Latescibacteria bacterium]|nr:hypothetical protein [Candidatus Latescibacterota bacterium]
MVEPFAPGILSKEALDARLDALLKEYEIVAPVNRRGQAHFSKIIEISEIEWGYSSSVIPPSKVIYQAEQLLMRFVNQDGSYLVVEQHPPSRQRILLGVHPCDIHGILVLERTLVGRWQDSWYAGERKRSLIIGLNCQNPGPDCFCSSFGTGPFYAPWMGQGPPEGCDLFMTELMSGYLIETFTEAGRRLLEGSELTKPTDSDLVEKDERHKKTLDQFTKHLNTDGLDALLNRHLEHPVWERVGEDRCLSCTNCTMVCPTCYCYDIVDRAQLDLKTILRWRRWDSCQDQHFAEVHFGNFRPSRKARLRQFVCHKLSYWMEQYGCYGCVGCGRCIHWCPTGIDLTEIAAEIRREEIRL